jgi:hypothetical protein
LERSPSADRSVPRQAPASDEFGAQDGMGRARHARCRGKAPLGSPQEGAIFPDSA